MTPKKKFRENLNLGGVAEKKTCTELEVKEVWART